MQHLDTLNTPPLTSTETSTLALSQANVDLTPKFEPSNKIYERNMLKKGRGYPLWVPECSQTLHIKKRKLGVEVGDVGLIDKDGYFVFLFNILLPANHPFHRRSMPEGYTPVQPLDPEDLMQTSVFGHHTALTSMSVRRHGSNPVSSSNEQNFEILSSEGVILTLPEGAQSSSIQTSSLWVNYMTRNLKGWYNYAKVTLGYEVNNGDIRLVTGCDKASCWGMAVAEQQPTAENSYRLRFRRATGRKAPAKHMWECDGIVDTRVGPSQDHIREVRRESLRRYLLRWLQPRTANHPQRDQCLFIKSINVRLDGKSWNEIKTEAEELYNNSGSELGASIGPSRLSQTNSSSTPKDASNEKELGTSPQVSPSNSKMSQARFVSGTPTPTVRKLYTDHHPADWLSRLLILLYPEAYAAVVDDNDWCFALRNIPDAIPIDENEMICAVLLESSFECLSDGESSNPFKSSTVTLFQPGFLIDYSFITD
ncbi:hypothetical protein BJ165DRAFT_1069438 [Panaeolus papilionaceus]|nr:hypothetical protein BJ165DRAFT_1069438 [Panaeolus papilionaceus]